MGRETQIQEPKWGMPKVYLGMTVLWRPEPTREPEPAIVTCVGGGNISLTIIPRGSRVGVTKDGIRHISDPSLKNIVHHEGVWDYNDLDRKVLSVIE